LEGKILAETLQERIKKQINDGNHRLAKENNTYYMLKYSQCPLVIVECGFLSNRKEVELLCDPEYQNKMALAIYLGIIEYLDNRNKPLVYTPESVSKKIVRNN
jgi:N-acetylmuramoyl-L-alanine amidase